MAVYKIIFIHTTAGKDANITEVAEDYISQYPLQPLRVFERVSKLPSTDSLLSFMATLRDTVEAPYVECLYAELAVDELDYFTSFGPDAYIKITLKNDVTTVFTITCKDCEMDWIVNEARNFKSATVEDISPQYHDIQFDLYNAEAYHEASSFLRNIFKHIYDTEASNGA